MNTLIQLAISLAIMTNKILVNQFPNGAYQVVVCGDRYLYNPQQGWFRPDGNYAPAKTAGELQERLNNAVIWLAQPQNQAAKPASQPAQQPVKQQPAAKQPVRRKNANFRRQPTKQANDACVRCGGLGEIPAYKHIDGGLCYWCSGTGLQSSRYTNG